MDALIEYGKILVPASVVLYAVYLMVRSIRLSHSNGPTPFGIEPTIIPPGFNNW